MTITNQLREAIQSYKGPLPAAGNSIEEVWFRQAVKQLYELAYQEKQQQQQEAK